MNIKVFYLTKEEADLLVGQTFAPDSYFNPIEDFYGNWIISNEEVTQCVNENFMWVKNLPQIDFRAREFVLVLTEEQKNSLIGRTYSNDSYFNPIQDYYDNWIITLTEIENCINEEFLWLKKLVPPYPNELLIYYKAKEYIQYE